MKSALDGLNRALQLLVLLAAAFNLLDGMNDGRVVASAERLSDIFQRKIGETASEVHREHSGLRDLLRALRAGQVDHLQIPLRGNDFENFFNRNLRPLRLFVQKIVEERFNLRHGQRLNRGVDQRGVGDQTHPCAVERADRRGNTACHVREELLRKLHHRSLLLELEERETRLVGGRCDLHGETRLEAGDQAGFKPLDLRRLLVRRHHDLLSRVVDGVEGVEELLLQALLAAEIVNVVHQQQIDVAEAVAELVGSMVLDGVDVFVEEAFAGGVADNGVWVRGLHMVRDGLHQVGFSHSGAAVNIERVVGAGRGGGGLSGGKGITVLLADHEVFKGVARVAVGSGENRGFGGGRNGVRLLRLGLHGLGNVGKIRFQLVGEIASGGFPDSGGNQSTELLVDHFREEVRIDAKLQLPLRNRQRNNTLKVLFIDILIHFFTKYGHRMIPQLRRAPVRTFRCHLCTLSSLPPTSY